MVYLGFAVLLAELVFFDKVIFIRIIARPLTIAKVPPYAANEIRNDDRNNNESKDLVHIKQEVVLHDALITRGVAHQGFKQLIKS